MPESLSHAPDVPNRTVLFPEIGSAAVLAVLVSTRLTNSILVPSLDGNRSTFVVIVTVIVLLEFARSELCPIALAANFPTNSGAAFLFPCGMIARS